MMLRFITIALAFISTAALASPADEGWKIYRTFNRSVILWEKPDGENFMRYAITNKLEVATCIIPHVHGNPRTRTGLKLVNLMPANSLMLHELGFVTYTTGSRPGSASWVVTLILIENQCSLPVSQPLPDPDPLLPLS